MVTRTLTANDQLTIVKLLASGRDADFVGTVVKVSRDIVIDIASRHGHPDKQKLAWAADIMQANIDKERASGIPSATPIRSAARATGTTLAAAPSPQGPAEPAAQSRQPEPQTASSAAAERAAMQQLELIDLLDLACKSGKAATRTKGERLTKLISELRQAIRDETEDRVRAEKEKKRHDAARAEIVSLEAQLAAARAKLGIGKKAKKANGFELFERPGRSPAQLEALNQRSDHQDEVLTRNGSTRAEVISWAQAHGWPDASPRGRFIKTEIVDAYDRWATGRA